MSSPQSLDQRAGRVLLAHRGGEERNSAGSPTTRPNSRSSQSPPSVPSSMPNGTTQSALSGAACRAPPASRSRCRRSRCAPRRRGCARRARAAPARSRRRRAPPRDRGPARRARAPRRAPGSPRRRARRSGRRPIRSRSTRAFITPPLNSTCVGQAMPLGPRRTGAPGVPSRPCRREELREVPRDRRVGRVGQADLLQAHAPRARGPRVAAHRGEEAVDERRPQVRRA